MSAIDGFPQLLTIREVCQILRLSKSKVYRLFAAGVLVGPQGKPLRIFAASIRAYLDTTNERPEATKPRVKHRARLSPELRF